MARYPAYKIMYNKLKEDIDNDVYPVGTFLPPEGELEKIFHVSRTTVRHAIDLLVREGVIRVKQGYGTEVVKLKSPSFSKSYQKSIMLSQLQENSPIRAVPIQRGPGLIKSTLTDRLPNLSKSPKKQRYFVFSACSAMGIAPFV